MSPGAKFDDGQREHRKTGGRHETGDTSPVIDLEGIEDISAHVEL